MATGDVYGLGLLATSLTGSVYQQAAQAQLSPYLNYGTTSGLGAFQVQYNPNYNGYTVTATTTAEVGPQKAAPRWKHAARAIDRLRGEIADWHGDVLMRKAYA